MENRVLGAAARRLAIMAGAAMSMPAPVHDPKPQRFKKASAPRSRRKMITLSGTSWRQLKRQFNAGHVGTINLTAAQKAVHDWYGRPLAARS